ncbi:tryptophan--tRNA ligase cytoplasmic [Prunus yedoensis var. nudiflora]|uniref:Tryptophan--tRNA ligase, cytoplasmic n=1 Tax=Prunus yedoensis var. nudiflora TaxID=2094558 RepID=A0A314ZUN9_PRUYE|nr:tryptophan--tRNA ligase cytoplasmic [Prunus yedoensis var. nudiflora]
MPVDSPVTLAARERFLRRRSGDAIGAELRGLDAREAFLAEKDDAPLAIQDVKLSLGIGVGNVDSQSYKNVVKVGKCVTYNKVVGIFGFTWEDHIGKVFHLCSESCSSIISKFLSTSFGGQDNLRCLIPCTIDQDPYFRMTRDVAPRIAYQKSALIESSFFPAMQGETGKMSPSDPNSAIYVTDSAKEIKNKINRYAFSGGQDSIEKQRELGANLEVDLPFKYLSFFVDYDAKLEVIRKEYGAGRVLTGEVKQLLIQVLTELVERHRRAGAAVTDEMVDAFMAVRPLPNMFS